MSREKVKVGGLFLNLSTRCNMRCMECYGHLDDFSGPEMTLDAAQRATRLFFENRLDAELRGGHDTVIMLFGGEPLLNWELIEKYTDWVTREYSKEKWEYRFAISTNGLLLDEAKSDFLLSRGFEIFISIDGPESIHTVRRELSSAQFRHLTGVIQSVARRAPAAVSTYTVVSRTNLPGMQAILDFFYGLGLRRAAIGKENYESFWRPEEHEALYSELLRFKERHPEFSFNVYAEVVGNCETCRPMYMMVYPNGTIYDLCLTSATVLRRSGKIPPEDVEVLRLGNIWESETLELDVERKRDVIRTHMFCPAIQRSYDERMKRLW